MRNNFSIRILAMVLALVMIISGMPAAAAAPTQSDAEAYKTIAEYLEDQKTTFDRIDPAAEVEFIVELTDAPMAGSMPEGMKLADYLNTRPGAVQANAIKQQQAVMAAAIEDAAAVSVERSYALVLNGFAVRGTYRDRAALEALPGVKRVAVANTYAVPERMAAEGELITSGELINADAVNAEGYTGQGTFAAILDTGLKVDHEAFIGEKVQGAVITKAFIASLDDLVAAGDLYKNAKVAFAYDYADEDDDVTDSQGHGTHVAGTVAANGENFRGVAPDAQLAIMKVFSDSGSAFDSDILAALEDCVLLGVDTINMSLGTPCGFTYESEIVDEAYNTVRAAGINLMISAGNDYNSAFQNLHGTDLALAENPDYGIVGSPSTYAAALSVASVNENLAYTSFFQVGANQISFDENPDAALKIGDLEGTYEYVRVSGVGNANDFSKVDVAGKVALVERGEISFTEKERNAYDAGAVAMIVYNNSDAVETVYMQLNGLIPAVFISKSEGKLMMEAADKTVTFSSDFSGRLESPHAGTMSDFSSMGVAPDLSLKPEITAPGGNVWSASISGGYEEMSGTSMAAPHMTGAAALIRQYVNESFPGLSEFEKQALIDNLLLSTAAPVEDPNGVLYTPRKQGAGLANVSAAIHSGAYLTVEGGKPKAELGDSDEGVYEFTFTVHNISDSTKTYHISVDPIAAQTEEHDGKLYISELCRAMTENELQIICSADTVTVQPGKTADVTVKLELTEAGKAALSVFPNGIYLEGFVRLTGDDVTALGLPYLGFYGDWADAPIFDGTMYDDETAFMVESAMAQMDYNGQGYYLGVNAITGNARPEWISYASRTAGYYLLTPMQGLLRAPKEIRYTAVSDASPEEPVYVMDYENAFKSFYYASGGFIYADYVAWADSWQPIGGNDDEGYYYLEDGPYTYRVEARIDGESEYQMQEYPVYIDNAGPQVLEHSYAVVDGRPVLNVQVTDNHYIMAAQLVDENFTTALSPIIAVEETELGAVTNLVFDLTEVLADGYEHCRLDLFDYAWNETQSDTISTVSQNIEPQTVQILENTVTANADSGNMEMHAIIEPDNAANKTLVWTSSDDTVARVVSVSQDTLTAEIDFVGVGSCEIRATATNGVYGTASVTVSQPDDDGPVTEPVVPADKEDLLLAIQMAKALDEKMYTAESWAVLQEALAAAEAVAADPNATQAQVEEATRNLNLARETLIALGDLSALRELYEQALEELERLAQEVFPEKRYTAFLKQLEQAEKLLTAGDGCTQEEADAACNALLDAWNALREYPVNTMYTDIPEGTWFYGAVDFVTRYGFMNGMDAGAFNPDTEISRAQFVVILYRIAGSPAVSLENPFADVPAQSWFTDAVLWAYANGITTGVDASHFNPGDSLMRQNMVTFLMRFAKTMGLNTDARADLSGYTDANQIAQHALEPMQWAVAEGIISGMSADTLGPSGLAKRAQIATIILRFVPKYLW